MVPFGIKRYERLFSRNFYLSRETDSRAPRSLRSTERLLVGEDERLGENLVSWASSQQRMAIKKGVGGSGDSSCQGQGSGEGGEIHWSEGTHFQV